MIFFAVQMIFFAVQMIFFAVQMIFFWCAVQISWCAGKKIWARSTNFCQKFVAFWFKFLLPYGTSFAALWHVFCGLMLNFWSTVQKSVAFLKGRGCKSLSMDSLLLSKRIFKLVLCLALKQLLRSSLQRNADKCLKNKFVGKISKPTVLSPSICITISLSLSPCLSLCLFVSCLSATLCLFVRLKL